MTSKDVNKLAQEVLESEEEVSSGLPSDFYGNSGAINLDGAVIFVTDD